MNILNKIKLLTGRIAHMMPEHHIKCATVGNKNYCHTVDVVGEIVETDSNGWVKYGCGNAGKWCIQNEIYTFDVMSRYLCKKDYKLHYIFGFVYEEDAMAFKLGCEHVY